MKKSILTLTAVALATVATPAAARSLTAEVRFGNVNSADTRAVPDSTEYKVEYWDSIGSINVGAELQTKQGENAGALGSKVSLKAGPSLPTVAGVHLVAYGELGKNLTAANNYEFWGVAIKARKNLIGPLSATVGYRHREGFDVVDLNEERLNAGLGYAVDEKLALGVNYYRTRGTKDSNVIGVSVTRSF